MRTDWPDCGTKKVVWVDLGRPLVSRTGRLERTKNGVLATGYGRFWPSTTESRESPTKSR